MTQRTVRCSNSDAHAIVRHARHPGRSRRVDRFVNTAWPGPRATLETWGLEAHSERRLSEYQLRTLLGLATPWDLHALFKERKVDMYTLEEFERDLATNQEFRNNHPVHSRA